MNSEFRHVAKTGDIKYMVIVEESGIAKGIRRVIALTGEEAFAAQLRLSEASHKLNEIKSMADAKAKDDAIKAFQQEASQLELALVGKATLLDDIANVRKTLSDASKAADKLQSQRVRARNFLLCLGQI